MSPDHLAKKQVAGAGMGFQRHEMVRQRHHRCNSVHTRGSPSPGHMCALPAGCGTDSAVVRSSSHPLLTPCLHPVSAEPGRNTTGPPPSPWLPSLASSSSNWSRPEPAPVSSRSAGCGITTRITRVGTRSVIRVMDPILPLKPSRLRLRKKGQQSRP